MGSDQPEGSWPSAGTLTSLGFQDSLVLPSPHNSGPLHSATYELLGVGPIATGTRAPRLRVEFGHLGSSPVTGLFCTFRSHALTHMS
jgi:hypothetical protein